MVERGDEVIPNNQMLLNEQCIERFIIEPGNSTFVMTGGYKNDMSEDVLAQVKALIGYLELA